jgi:hypothetical protein
LAKSKHPTIPLLVRLDGDLEGELDRLRDEEGLVTAFVVNEAVREWLERYYAPMDTVRRHVTKQLKKDRNARDKEESEWQRFQPRAISARQKRRP